MLLLSDTDIRWIYFYDFSFFIFFKSRCIYVFQAPLASDEDDDGEDKDSYTSAEQQYLIELTQPVTNLLSTMDSRPRSSRSKKGSSIVVPASSVSIIDRPSSARIVRIRLIFIHIGKQSTERRK